MQQQYELFQEIGERLNNQENLLRKRLFRYLTTFRLPLAIILSLFIFSAISTQAASPAASAVVYSESKAETINAADIFYIEKINNLRASLGKSYLFYKPALERSAVFKAQDMINNKYWGHFSPYGSSFSDFIWRQSPFSEKVGENLAKCYESRNDAFRALVNSPSHYEIMVGDFTHVGIAERVNLENGCNYTVLHFAKN
jgi:uncharacterized protein YkwD